MNVIRTQILQQAKGFQGNRPVTISKEMLEQVVANFNSGIRWNLKKGVKNDDPLEIPCFATHQRHFEGQALGWITSLGFENDGKLYADIELTDLGKEKLEQGVYKSISPEIDSVPDYGYLMVAAAFTAEPAQALDQFKVVASRQIEGGVRYTLERSQPMLKFKFVDGKMVKLEEVAPPETVVDEQPDALSKTDIQDRLKEMELQANEDAVMTALEALHPEPWTMGEFLKVLEDLQLANVEISEPAPEVTTPPPASKQGQPQTALSRQVASGKSDNELKLEKRLYELERSNKKLALEKDSDKRWGATYHREGKLTPAGVSLVADIRMELSETNPELAVKFEKFLDAQPARIPMIGVQLSRQGEASEKTIETLSLEKAKKAKTQAFERAKESGKPVSVTSIADEFARKW